MKYKIIIKVVVTITNGITIMMISFWYLYHIMKWKSSMESEVIQNNGTKGPVLFK